MDTDPAVGYSYFTLDRQEWYGRADWRNDETGDLMFYWIIRRHESSGQLGCRIIAADSFTPDEDIEDNEVSVAVKLKRLQGIEDDE